MGEKTLKIIIYLAGIFCLLAFIAVRSLPVLNSVLVEKIVPDHFEFTKYGELYYQSYISHFKEELPTPIRKFRFSEKHSEASEADILIFGDSFLDISRQTTLPERLSDSLGVKVFYHRFQSQHKSNPFCFMEDFSPLPGKPRTVIYESVERNIGVKFDNPYLVGGCAEYWEKNMQGVDRIVKVVFPGTDEEMYRQFLKRSVFTTGLFAANARIKFDLFGYMSSNTPIYKTGDQPWLFLGKQLDDEPGSYYYQHSAEQIERYCDHIALLAKQMKDELNMEMIFLPIPNKYTLYHGVVNDDPYNNFLPLIYEGLRERNVSCIELYEDFLNNEEVLYYGTDSHWNKKGVDIALSKVVKKLNLE